ncbi:aldo/keto reductase [Streptomyces sp. CB02058]|nr:aldo/keto reductase [Streptomyces sp. CB02058]OKI96170.1 aldo/keto reductase [Streptomyces sp. CB02058]
MRTDMDGRTRVLGRSGIGTGALGLGCWAIGGEWSTPDGSPLGWGRVDDEESVAAVRRALELGVRFFDTADVYGAGHSERVLGKALAGRRDEAVIATKWGNLFDERTRTMDGADRSPGYAREALIASLRRLGTDRIDLFQLHLGDVPLDEAAELREACEGFVAEGLIRAYGWSTDDPERAALFADGEHCAAVQYGCNVLEDAPGMLSLSEERGLLGIIRSPLAMGLLAGPRGAGGRGRAGDIRSAPPAWLHWFEAGGVPSAEWAARVEAVREVLTSDGRTLAQGAIGWLWARSGRTVPIPGFRTVAQVEENAGALDHGPLGPGHLKEIADLLA